MPCNKIPYSTKSEAKQEARIQTINMRQFSKRMPKHGNQKLRPYRCQDCGLWHLTSKPKLKYMTNK